MSTITRVGTDATANASATPVSPTYPTGIAAGDMLIITVAVNGTGTVTTPAGYTLMDTLTENVLVVREYAKIASGSETGALAIAFATATGAVATIKARRSSTGFDTTLANNFSTFKHDVNTGTITTITTTAMTGVPVGAWLEAHGGANKAVTSGVTVTVTGTNWTERTDDVNSTTARTALDTADNTTDTGTANSCIFTWSGGNDNVAAISYYIFGLPAKAGNTFFWSM